MEDSNDQVLFLKGLSHAEALVLVGALEAEDIPVLLKSENLGGHLPGGVSNMLFVSAEDLERAQEVYQSRQAASSAELNPPAAAENLPAKRAGRFAVVGAIVCLVFLGVSLLLALFLS